MAPVLSHGELSDDSSQLTLRCHGWPRSVLGSTHPPPTQSSRWRGRPAGRVWESSRERFRRAIERDPAFREEFLKEGVECLLAGDVDTGKAVLRGLQQSHRRPSGAWCVDREVSEEPDAYVRPQRQPPGPEPV